MTELREKICEIMYHTIKLKDGKIDGGTMDEATIKIDKLFSLHQLDRGKELPSDEEIEILANEYSKTVSAGSKNHIMEHSNEAISTYSKYDFKMGLIKGLSLNIQLPDYYEEFLQTLNNNSNGNKQ